MASRDKMNKHRRMVQEIKEWQNETEAELNEAWKSEDALRDTPEWLKALGPEDEDREQVMKNLEEYGFETWNEGSFVSSPLASQDMPDWASREADKWAESDDELSRQANTTSSLTNRPVEDIVTDRVDGDDEADLEDADADDADDVAAP